MTGADRWLWRLTGPDDRVLAHHDVRLNLASAQYEAAVDLLGYLWRHTPPDLRDVREAEIVHEVGGWLGEQVLGPVADALRAAAPCAVRVVVPADAGEPARRLLSLPLELAHAQEQPLALQDVTLVTQCGPDTRPPDGGPMPRTGQPVRILALFSLPEDSRALNLRRERRRLERRFTEAARAGRGVEIHCLQYGVTRERLKAVLARPEGWDVIHVSGHGTPGELLLETDSGLADRVAADEVTDLLSMARGVKLVTLSACWSAGRAVRQRRRLLSLSDQHDAEPTAKDAEQEPAPGPAGPLANMIAEQLECAVLAMRYPVADDFAAALAERVYSKLILDGQPLPRALAGTVKELSQPDEPVPQLALQAGTATLSGARALELTMPAPASVEAQAAETAAGTLPVPERFVGRVMTMARAGAALSPDSALRGVLLQGMPGVGKTACAAELAATHEHAFEKVIWFRAAAETAPRPDPGGALTELVAAIEQAVPELDRAELPAGPGRFGELLTQLRARTERRRLLLVIDGIDHLLTADRDWRDGRWKDLLHALAGHSGRTRLILSGRTVPRTYPSGLLTVPVGPLTHDECLLLLTELPRLAQLASVGVPGITDRPGEARRLAGTLLAAAGGHPLLLELADGLCADPGRLAEPASSVRRAHNRGEDARTGVLSAGQATVGDVDHLQNMRVWTGTVVGCLPPEVRDLFYFLCCLEEADRTLPTVEQNWPDLRSRLGHGGTPVDVSLLTAVDQGLLTLRGRTGDVSLEIHHVIAGAGRELAGGDFRAMVDTRMAGYWVTVFEMAWTREGTDTDGAHLTGPLIARAGMSAVPYLARDGNPEVAEGLLEAVLLRDATRPVAARVAPLMRRLAVQHLTGGGGQRLSAAHTRVMRLINPEQAAAQTRRTLERARAAKDYEVAAGATGRLIESAVRAGRIQDALALAEEQIQYVRRAGFGGWERCRSEVNRVHVLANSQHVEQALTEAADLIERMRPLPRGSRDAESASWWAVWEELLDTAQRAAVRVGRWEQALTYNAELCASKEARGAPLTDLVQARHGAYMPLLELGRTDAALSLVDASRQIAERLGDPFVLADVFGALGNIEDARGHGDVAIDRARDCLRYAYRAQVPHTIAIGHVNIGTYLKVHARDGTAAVAHHLAAVLLGRLTGGVTSDAGIAIAGDLYEFGPELELPGSPEALCERVGQVPGVDLLPVLRQLAPGPATLSGLLESVIEEARQQVEQPSAGSALAEAVWSIYWEPLIAALVAATRGNTAAYINLRKRLAELETLDPRFAEPAARLRRLYDGERGPDVLADLEPLDTAVVSRARQALENEVTVPTELRLVLNYNLALGTFVAAAAGDEASASVAREGLADFAADASLVPMSAVLNEVVAGSREAGLLTQLDDPVQREVVALVLRHISHVEAAMG
ncbi:CHAT domain-containing protein [Streptomyces aureocirculatus]|nr:CHAT domain-containing protein [Streptomyces aureocirculatus]